MQTIGERLEEARKRKGISIREAAEATKIRGDYLQKFEGNSYEVDLPPLYIRGFLRGYARYLGLDAERLGEEFDALRADQGKAARRETRENYGRVEFGGDPGGGSRAAEQGEHAEPASAARPQLDQLMLMKFALLGLAALVVVLVILLVVKMLFSDSERPPQAQPSVSAQAVPSQTLTFTASDPTRLKIVRELDGAIVFDGTLARGQSRSFKKQGKFIITVDFPKNLRMEVNGRVYPVPIESYGRFGLD